MVELTTDSMRWANALSTRPSLEAAIAEVVTQAKDLLQRPADLGFVFISSAFASEYSRLLPLLRDQLPDLPLIGCSGGGIVGMTVRGKALEVEGEPALSLTLAYLPGVKVKTFHLEAEELPDLDSSPDAWAALLGVPLSDQPHFVLLADPFSAKINDLLQGLDYAYAGASKVGGLASSGAIGGNSGLFCDDRFYREGTVGVALSGNLVLETIVAQGCRPIGEVYWVTEGERNILLGLQEQDCLDKDSTGGCATQRLPLEVLRDLIQTLSEDDRELAQHSLFVGVAQSEFKQDLEQGDFLIRNLLGVDPRVGAIAIGDRIRPGQRIQFHLRDAETSADDLEVLLQRYQKEAGSRSSPVGALMFSCLGRGEALYGEPNFDSQLFREYLDDVPLSGFFCNGEIGPVGNSTFLHGYTSVFGICRERREG
jgi:small ligand-binding sensory domain FIST